MQPQDNTNNTPFYGQWRGGPQYPAYPKRVDNTQSTPNTPRMQPQQQPTPGQHNRPQPKAPEKMPKARAMALVDRLKKGIAVASIVSFGTFSGLVAMHQIGTTSQTTSSSTPSPSTPTATATATSSSSNYFSTGSSATTSASPQATSTSASSSTATPTPTPVSKTHVS